MKTIKCKVDNLGRIVLPIQYRKALGIEAHDYVDMEFKNNGMFVFKATEMDVLRSKMDDVMIAACDCPDISADEAETLVSILSKLVKEGAE